VKLRAGLNLYLRALAQLNFERIAKPELEAGYPVQVDDLRAVDPKEYLRVEARLHLLQGARNERRRLKVLPSGSATDFKKADVGQLDKLIALLILHEYSSERGGRPPGTRAD
jgi:hypothetical protein